MSPLLNTAPALYAGSTPAKAVYLGNTLVWSPPPTTPRPTTVAISAPHYGVGTQSITLTVPAAAQTGDLIVMVCMAVNTLTGVTPAGWTVLCPLTVVNTRAFTVQARIRQASDDSTYTWTVTGSAARTAVLAVIRGGPSSLSALVTSTPWKRAASGTVTTASGVTAPDSSLVLSIFGEASTTDETPGFVPAYSNGFTAWGYAPQSGAGQIEAIGIATKTPSAGATGDTTATYQNASLNGIAVQVAIPPVWNPKSIPGLTLWIDAQQQVDSDGAKMTVVKDWSAANRTCQITAGNEPYYRTNSSGYPCMEWMAAAYGLDCGQWNPGTEGLTFFFVGRLTGGSYRMMCVWGPDSDGFEMRHSSSAQEIVLRYGSHGVVYQHTTPSTGGADYLWALRVNRTDSTAYTNTVPKSGPTVAMPNINQTLYVGRRQGGYPFIGPMREVLVYAGSLSDTDVNKVFDYLVPKWGLTRG